MNKSCINLLTISLFMSLLLLVGFILTVILFEQITTFMSWTKYID